MLNFQKTFKLRNRMIIAFASVFILISYVATQKSSNGELVKRQTALTPSQWHPGQLFLPVNGCISDSATAVKVAEAVWSPVYGELIQNEKPFQAELLNDSVWVVSGTLLGDYTRGGVAYIEIRKTNGEIIGMGHSK